MIRLIKFYPSSFNKYEYDPSRNIYYEYAIKDWFRIYEFLRSYYKFLYGGAKSKVNEGGQRY